MPEQPLSYHVAKAGLRQLVRHEAVAMGPLGVRVNCVSPSRVIASDRDGADGSEPSSSAQAVPLGRHCTRADVADAVSFLLGPRAAFITGQDIVLDGGASCSWPGS